LLGNAFEGCAPIGSGFGIPFGKLPGPLTTRGGPFGDGDATGATTGLATEGLATLTAVVLDTDDAFVKDDTPVAACGLGGGGNLNGSGLVPEVVWALTTDVANAVNMNEVVKRIGIG
jgi:hypothetical protein